MPVAVASLDLADLDAIVSHPLQAWALDIVARLLHDLRACDTAEEYGEFQKLLFQHVWQTEKRRGEVRRAWKRVRQHKAPTHGPDLPAGRDPANENSWRLEDLVTERVLRQLRTVGDALAWRVSRFDRRYILAASRNAGAGPMAGKEGLAWELGAVEDLWRERRHFGLLHDLTSCLRIGDITEFTSDGRQLLHEVKKGRGRSSEQRRRMEAVVRAVNDGAPLPNSTEQLVPVDVMFRTHLPLLRDALDLAQERGAVGLRVPGGRALIAANLITLGAPSRFSDPQEGIDLATRTRAAVLRRAGIAEHDHHLNMRSADWAARSPTAVPYGVYPLLPEQAAALICDFTVVETVLSVKVLFEHARSREMRPEMLLPDASGELRSGQPMFRFVRGDRGVVLHAGVAAQLLAELIEVDVFLDGLYELLTRPLPPASPLVTFADEAATWR